jgi:hypothetical protein
MEAKSINSSKRRGVRTWISCFSILVGLPLLLYFGYCWGVWGRQSLLLQYLFQCNCPAASEEARYPRSMEVVIPACQTVNVFFRLSPSGRFLYMRKEENGLASAKLLDLQTGERLKVTDQRISSFLTDHLWFIEGGVEGHIIDVTNGTEYPIKTFRFWQENTYINGAPNLELLVLALLEAEQVFFTANNDTVIVLMSEFPTNLEQNFTFDRSDIPGWDSNRVDLFLKENNIIYQTVLADFPHEAVSFDGRFIARDDGIFLAKTNQLIVETPVSLVKGWTYDNRGVIYASSRCLFRYSFPFADDSACFRRVPQPVIMVKVPEEYLSPDEVP